MVLVSRRIEPTAGKTNLNRYCFVLLWKYITGERLNHIEHGDSTLDSTAVVAEVTQEE